MDKKGNETEHFDYHLGIKKVEIVGEVFKINGKNVKLRGVNRHDHHPRTGRFVDNATLEKDNLLMKQANVNFLRTSHYPDRKRSAFIGRYKMPLAEMMTEYLHPQDNGNRCDVRWLELSASPTPKPSATEAAKLSASGSSLGRSLRIEGLQPLCIRAWDYAEEDVTVAHPYELKRGEFVNLNIDLNIHGVAGTDTWGQRALPQYTIDGNKPYKYSFLLKMK